MVGVAGFEPATLRLSSACSNQLSYTPSGSSDFRFRISDVQMMRAGRLTIRNPNSSFRNWQGWRHGDSNPRPIACKATALPTELCPQGFGQVLSAVFQPGSNLGYFPHAPGIGNFLSSLLKQKLNCALPFQISDASASFVAEVLGSHSKVNRS